MNEVMYRCVMYRCENACLLNMNGDVEVQMIMPFSQPLDWYDGKHHLYSVNSETEAP